MSVVRAALVGLLSVTDIVLPPTATIFAGNPKNATFDAFLEIDVTYFNLETSVADTIILCAFRGFLTALCFCADGPIRTLARLVGILSTVYLLIKISICNNWAYAYTYIIYAAVLTIGILQSIFLDRRVNVCCHKKGSKHSKAATAGDIEQGNEKPLLDPLASNENPPDSTAGKEKKDKISTKPKSVHACRLIRLAGPEKWILAAGTLCLVLASVGLMLIPQQFGGMIALIANNSDAQDVQTHLSELQWSVLYLLLINLGTALFSFLRGGLFQLAGERLVARFRRKMFRVIIHKDIQFFDGLQSGELVNRLAADSAAIQDAVTSNVSMALRWLGQAVAGMVLLFITSPRLTGIMLACVPAVTIGAVVYGRYVKDLTKTYQTALADSGEVATETLGNVRTVRSFANEETETGRYSNAIVRSRQIGIKRSWAYGTFLGAVTAFGYIAVTAVFYYGGVLVIKGEMSTGDLFSFILNTLIIAASLAGLSSLWGTLMQALGASERMFQLLDAGERHTLTKAGHAGIIPANKGGSESQSHINGEIKFRDVHFRYPTRPEQPVLKGVSFTASPGEVVALVGPSGAGKSTVVSLIERFYNVDSGVIEINGVPVNDIDYVWLHRNIALVSQEPVLFGCSIRDNIQYASVFLDDSGEPRKLTDEDIERAARQANAHNFIMEFPKGYDTMVGERGLQLSGGQKQRIAIARAILMNPQILLLDEATSALDAESEHLVQQALDKLMLSRTTIVIAHRLSTVRNAHCVLVVQDGMIHESGSHDELIQNENGVYFNLVQRQMQK